MTQPDASNGRYRFQGQQPLDPNADVHPEMLSTASMEAVSGHIPNTPNDLIAMQESESRANRPEKPERKRSEKVTQVLELIKTLSTSPADDQAIASRHSFGQCLSYTAGYLSTVELWRYKQTIMQASSCKSRRDALE